MPNRILREGILTSPRMAKLGWAEEVFYRRLHSVVDDFGRYYADVGMLRAACYPRQLNKVSDSDVGKWVRSCADAALVRVYPAKDGESYLEVLDFAQQVRAKKSKFPGPLSTCAASDTQESGIGEANAPVFVFGDVSVDGGVSVVGAASSPPGPPAVPVAKAGRERRKCPDDFAVSSDLLDWASAQAPLAAVEAETAKFRDHTFKTARSDWPGTWRNWMRKAHEDAASKPHRGQPNTGEPAWRTEQRQRNAAFAGPYAAKSKHELEVVDGTARLVG